MHIAYDDAPRATCQDDIRCVIITPARQRIYHYQLGASITTQRRPSRADFSRYAADYFRHTLKRAPKLYRQISTDAMLLCRVGVQLSH